MRPRHPSRSVVPALLAAAVGLLLWLLPEAAFAWGPATHVSIALDALEALAYFRPDLQAFLIGHLHDFLYGCMASDIAVGKRFMTGNGHGHHWSMQERLVHAARTDGQRAFAHGYLSHLAADTVAHNLYVPARVVASYSTVTLQHCYWEVRFDALMDPRVWFLGRRAAARAGEPNDPLLKGALGKTPLPFRTNKRLFTGFVGLSGLDQWQRLVHYHARLSRWTLSPAVAARYHRLALETVLGYFLEGPQATCLSLDPTGRENLVLAKRLRVTLRASGSRAGVRCRDALREFEREFVHVRYNPMPPLRPLADREYLA